VPLEADRSLLPRLIRDPCDLGACQMSSPLHAPLQPAEEGARPAMTAFFIISNRDTRHHINSFFKIRVYTYPTLVVIAPNAMQARDKHSLM
jgi:hypothetical protein